MIFRFFIPKYRFIVMHLIRCYIKTTRLKTRYQNNEIPYFTFTSNSIKDLKPKTWNQRLEIEDMSSQKNGLYLARKYFAGSDPVKSGLQATWRKWWISTSKLFNRVNKDGYYVNKIIKKKQPWNLWNLIFYNIQQVNRDLLSKNYLDH